MPSFVHSLSIERPYGVDGIDVDADTDLDEYGQPTRTFSELAAVPGLIQPKTAREIALASQAGAAIGNHTIFLGRQDLTTADRIRDVTEDAGGPAVPGARRPRLQLRRPAAPRGRRRPDRLGRRDGGGGS
jgi:hypothetical protein